VLVGYGAKVVLLTVPMDLSEMLSMLLLTYRNDNRKQVQAGDLDSGSFRAW
jgi:hypothetical protein